MSRNVSDEWHYGYHVIHYTKLAYVIVVIYENGLSRLVLWKNAIIVVLLCYNCLIKKSSYGCVVGVLG